MLSAVAQVCGQKESEPEAPGFTLQLPFEEEATVLVTFLAFFLISSVTQMKSSAHCLLSGAFFVQAQGHRLCYILVVHLYYARIPHPSLSPRVCTNSCPLNRWFHPTISSSVTHFSSCPQSFPASGSRLFVSVGQSIGASAPVLPVNIQGWFPSRLAGLIWCYSLAWCNRNPLLWLSAFLTGKDGMGRNGVHHHSASAVSNRKLQTDELREVKKRSHLS